MNCMGAYCRPGTVLGDRHQLSEGGSWKRPGCSMLHLFRKHLQAHTQVAKVGLGPRNL